MSYINQEVETAVNALRELELEFTERKKGQQFRAIINTIAYTFPEDRQEILASYLPERKEKKTGNAKIVRSQPKAKKSIDSGCADCPPDNAITSNERKRPRIIGRGASDRKKTAGEPRKFDAPPSTKFESLQQVVEAFDNDVELMLMFAKAQQIDTGKASTADGVAKKIFAHVSHSEK